MSTETETPYYLQQGNANPQNPQNPQSDGNNPKQFRRVRQASNISMPNEHSDIFGAFSNMCNAILGAGIIGIPYAIANAGFVVGLIMLFVVSYMTDKSLRMVVDLASFHPKLRHLGVLTYEDLARIPFGRFGSYLVLINMFVLAYGAMVAILLVIKDTIPIVTGFAEHAGHGSFVESELTMIITSLFIVLPMSMMRDSANLEKISLLGVIADVVLVGCVLIIAPVKSTLAEVGGFDEVIKDNWINSRLFISLGVMSTAMNCHDAAFIISTSLKDRTPQRWSAVTFRSLLVAGILSLLIGIYGYLGFLDDTKGDILNNFPEDSTIANWGRIMLAATMFLTYPMECLVARHVIVAIFFDGDMDGLIIGPDGEKTEAPKFLGIMNRRHILTWLIYISTIIPASLVDDLGPVLSLSGAIGASFLAYICCGMVYIGVNGEDFIEFCRNLLLGKDYTPGTQPITRHYDLPLVGDSKAIMSVSLDIPDGWKPWWWYLFGFPLWVHIARKGAVGTRNFIRDLTGDDFFAEDFNIDNNIPVVGPQKRDYYISMFFITFGIVAAIVGVGSNFYVYIDDIFYAIAFAAAYKND